jgi:hypothetical protein
MEWKVVPVLSYLVLLLPYPVRLSVFVLLHL